MRGLGVVLRVPTLIRGDRTQRGKCCVFSYGIGFLNKQQRAAIESCEALRRVEDSSDDRFWYEAVVRVMSDYGMASAGGA